MHGSARCLISCVQMKEALYRELRGTAALQATRDAFGSLPNEPPTLPKGAVWKAVENGDLDSLCVLMEDGHSPEETDEVRDVVKQSAYSKPESCSVIVLPRADAEWDERHRLGQQEGLCASCGCSHGPRRFRRAKRSSAYSEL